MLNAAIRNARLPSRTRAIVMAPKLPAARCDCALLPMQLQGFDCCKSAFAIIVLRMVKQICL
jgi:hypothetical protein